MSSTPSSLRLKALPYRVEFASLTCLWNLKYFGRGNLRVSDYGEFASVFVVTRVLPVLGLPLTKPLVAWHLYTSTTEQLGCLLLPLFDARARHPLRIHNSAVGALGCQHDETPHNHINFLSRCMRPRCQGARLPHRPRGNSSVSRTRHSATGRTTSRAPRMSCRCLYCITLVLSQYSTGLDGQSLLSEIPAPLA